MSLGKSIEHTMGRCRPALLHHTFVLSSSLSPDKVGNELSHPSALWVPVFRWLGNKVIVLLLQNRVSQSKQWEIGQLGVIEGGKSAMCSRGSFGCIVDLPNKMRKNSPYSFSMFTTRLCEPKITSELSKLRAPVFIVKVIFLHIKIVAIIQTTLF